MVGSDTPRAMLAVSAFALQDCLVEALCALAIFHDREAGEWLDDLERKFVLRTKDSQTGRLPSDRGPGIVDGAISMVLVPFSLARRRIAANEID
jgi:hypothetical protein